MKFVWDLEFDGWHHNVEMAIDKFRSSDLSTPYHLSKSLHPNSSLEASSIPILTIPSKN